MAALGAVVASPPAAEFEPFASPLRLPGVQGLYGLASARQITLTAEIRRHPLFTGRTTELMTYRALAGGRELFNPVLRIRKGEVLDATLDNRLGEDTTIHWHGMAVDEANDGSGMHPVAHGERYRYRFAVGNRAGMYWYHPHPHDRTGAQVHLGLGGLLMVEDGEDDELRRVLGVEPGKTEIPLVLQDKQVDSRNRIKYAMGEDDWIGNRMLVNLSPEPRLDVATCLHRFRVLNASNARTYLLAFMSSGKPLPFHVVGTDGGLLDKPAPASRAFLAPAQRLDVLVDFGSLLAGSTVMMKSLPYDPMENDGGGGDAAMEHPGAAPLGAPMDLLRIEVKHAVCAPRRIPRTLSSMPSGPEVHEPPRRFRLHIERGRWRINGYNFHEDMRAIRLAVRRGAREHWDIVNDMKSMPHPMHLHGFHFRVVSRVNSPAQVRALAVTASGLTAGDLGWLDTVLVWPGETVRIALDFSQPFTGTQRYMFHCHNLEHEDQGMMLNFLVEEPSRAR